MSLPDWLRDKLATPPSAGAGVHAWLFSCARQLHAHMPPDAVAAALTAATANAGRRVTGREIRDAVNNSYEVRWVEGGERPKGEKPTTAHTPRDTGKHRWPRPDPPQRAAMIAEAKRSGVGSAYDLWERSPAGMGRKTPDDWLDILFPGAEWLCLAEDHPATARTRRPAKWYFGAAEKCGLVVPSPMTAPFGFGLDGKQAHRCLGNTGPRRWLVIEFDSGTQDEQAALHWLLKESEAGGFPPLALVVSSGGKSLHGWYRVTNEESAKDLMAFAVLIGADPATWNRCQLVRLPAGVRKRPMVSVDLPDGFAPDGEIVEQSVLYFDPTRVERNQP